MIKQLYVNGCSWTDGDGLDKEIGRGPDWRGRNWASQLAKLLNVPVINEGMGGGSNARIVRLVCDFVRNLPREDRRSTLIVIGWTVTNRDEIYIEETNNWYPFNSNHEFRGRSYFKPRVDPHKVEDIERIRKQMVAHANTLYADTVRYLNQIFLIKNLLENLGIPFLFFQALPWIYPEEQISANETEGNLLKSKFAELECEHVMSLSKTFNEFIQVNNYPMSDCYHPLTDGHKAWADKLFEELKNRKIIQ